MGSSQDRPGLLFGFGYDGLGQDFVQVLRQTPDERRMPEDSVGIEVDRPVKAVPVVEVPVEHEHFVFTEVLQRVGAEQFSTGHGLGFLGLSGSQVLRF
jgi:hypothetical protein